MFFFRGWAKYYFFLQIELLIVKCTPIVLRTVGVGGGLQFLRQTTAGDMLVVNPAVAAITFCQAAVSFPASERHRCWVLAIYTACKQRRVCQQCAWGHRVTAEWPGIEPANIER